MHLRRSSQNKINNALIAGWPRGIIIDGLNTIAGAAAGDMYIKNSIVAGSTVASVDTANSNGVFNALDWFNTAANGNRIFAAAAEAGLTAPFDLNNPDFLPISSSPALSGAGAPPDDGYFDINASYVGAFGNQDWTSGWARFGDSTATSVQEADDKTIPSRFQLLQNYPNPFNPSTKISFSLTEGSKITLRIYNILGQQVAELVNGFRNAGTYEVTWNVSDLSGGMYIYRLEAGSNTITKKMTLLK